MHEQKGFENLVLKNTTLDALKRFAKLIEWPQHLAEKYPDVEAVAEAALREYFDWAKGNWGIADFLVQCNEAEIPAWLRDSCIKLKATCTPAPAPGADGDVLTAAAPANDELGAGADGTD
jgi:putative ATP-dependent endonuclease of the OLD family